MSEITIEIAGQGNAVGSQMLSSRVIKLSALVYGWKILHSNETEIVCKFS